MAINVLDWVLDESETKGAARHVMIVLAEASNQNGGGAYPSVQTMMRRAGGLGRRTVQENLRQLERQGHIRKEGTHSSGTNVYTVIGPFNDEVEEGGARTRADDEGGAGNAPPGGRKLRQGGAQIAAEGGAAPRTPGARGAALEPTPEPKPEPTEEPPTARAHVSVTDGFGELVDHLHRFAEAKGAKLDVDAAIDASETFLEEHSSWSVRELSEAAEEFADYWLTGAGENVPRRDANATWRNRLRVLPSSPVRHRPSFGRPANLGSTAKRSRFADARVAIACAKRVLPDRSDEDHYRAVNVLRELDAAGLPVTAEAVEERLDETTSGATAKSQERSAA